MCVLECDFMADLKEETLFKEFVVLKYGDGVRFTKIVELFDGEAYFDLVAEYPKYISCFEWFVGRYPREKRLKAIDNIYQRHRREVLREKVRMPSIVIKQDDKTIVLKPNYNLRNSSNIRRKCNLEQNSNVWENLGLNLSQNSGEAILKSKSQNSGEAILKSNGQGKLLNEPENIVEVDINISSDAGRGLYKEIQNNVLLRADYRNFIDGLLRSKRGDIEVIFDNLMDWLKVTSGNQKSSNQKSGNQKSGNQKSVLGERRRVAKKMRDGDLKEAIGNFTTFFNSIKNADWIPSFSAETLALGHTIASEIQGVQNGVGKLREAIEEPENENKRADNLMDLSKIDFSGVL